MKKENFFFTVVIPIYNSETYLKKTINSVLTQIKNDLQLILVNDNSTDNSLKICREFKNKNKNKNIIIINNKKNLGPGKSRNIGIEKAKGKYICYLDSDDFLISNTLKKIKKKIIKNNYPSVILNNIIRGNKTKDNSYLLNFFNSKTYDRESFIKKLIKNKIHINECWNIIIHKSIYKNDIEFPKTRLAEDNVYVTEVILKMRNILINKEKFIYHTTRINSLKHLINFNAVHSYLFLLNRYRDLMRIYKKNSLFKKYINSRIETAFKYLKVYIYLLKSNDILKLYKLQKNYLFYVYKIFKLKFKTNKITQKKYFQEIKKFQITFEEKLNKILFLNKKKNYKINIFCIDYIGKSAIKYFDERSAKINKIIDEDKNLEGNLIMGKKIYLLSKINKKDLRNSFNLICHQNLEVFKNFKNKLRKLKVNKKNIIHFKVLN